MSVVTAFRNVSHRPQPINHDITLFAVYPTFWRDSNSRSWIDNNVSHLRSFFSYIDSHCLQSNNSLRGILHKLALPSALINTVINDPSSLTSPSTLGITLSTVRIVLEKGYTKGFRRVFILNASFAAIATIISITMIKHKNLARGDEEQLKCQANELATAKILSSPSSSPTEADIKIFDIEAMNEKSI